MGCFEGTQGIQGYLRHQQRQQQGTPKILALNENLKRIERTKFRPSTNFTCGNIFKGDELGPPEVGGAVTPPVSIGWLDGGRATGAAISAASGIP